MQNFNTTQFRLRKENYTKLFVYVASNYIMYMSAEHLQTNLSSETTGNLLKFEIVRWLW